jgi:FHA domain/Domain of unknown function (DUF1707)
MAVDAPTPLPWRPSDREREDVVRSLRDSTASGRISSDTFSHRVERAYLARSRRELDDLMSDLPHRGRLHRSLVRAVESTAATLAEMRSAWREPHVERLPLPRSGTALTLGRSSNCGCVIGSETVSRRHARIRAVDGTWRLTDLGSLNGTHVNGFRVTGEVELRPGDRLSLGGVRLRVTAPR